MFAIKLLVLFTLIGVTGGSRPFMFEYGASIGDYEVEKEIYSVVQINLTTPMYFFKQWNSVVYIDTTGVIWPGWYCGTACDLPTPFPVQPYKQVVACYWADADLAANLNGKVYYRVAGDSATKATANSLLQKSYGSTVLFDFTSDKLVIIVATWVNLTYTGGNRNTPTNSFQCAIMSDGTNSYALFNYQDIQWANSPLEISINNYAEAGIDTGYSDPSENNYSLPFSHTPNVMQLTNTANFGFKKYNVDGWYILSTTAAHVPYSYPLDGANYVTCQANTDPHYLTFDQLIIDTAFGNTGQPVTSNQPFGNYILVATGDCKSTNYPPISVIVMIGSCNGGDDNDYPHCPHGVNVTLYFETAQIGQRKKNIEIVMYPDKYYIESNEYSSSYVCPADACASTANNYTFAVNPTSDGGNGFLLTSNFGLTVKLITPPPTPHDCQTLTTGCCGYVDVTLPYIDALTNNIFGYCGNMDGIIDNDNFCWDSSLENAIGYQNCWPASYLDQVTTNFGAGIYQCQNYPPTAPRTSEKDVASGFPDWVVNMCNVMINTTGPFAQCQSISSFYYTMCLLDMTSTNGDQVTLCSDVSQLAAKCLALQGVTSLNWRSANFCPLPCPENSTYSSRTSSCAATCDNPFATLFCPYPPAEGCVCNDGFVSNSGQCITMAQCSGCINDQGVMLVPGTQWTTSDCSRTCTCVGNGTVNCVNSPCDPNASCITVGTSAVCKCNDNYYGDGHFCSIINTCIGNNCQNGAICVSGRNSYTCLCLRGYTGGLCQTVINYCVTNPCVNGSCNSFVGGYNCTCNPGYSGTNCDQKKNYCASFPCTNLATCISLDLGYQCICATGYTGTNCQLQLPTTTMPPTTVVTTTGLPSFNCNGKPDGDYPNPENPCSNIYFTCVDGNALERNCQPGLYYDAVSDQCLQKSQVPACNTFLPRRRI